MGKYWMMAAMSALALMLVLAAFGETPTVTTFTDKRDGKTYKKVTIGKQVWMAENLNYDVPNVTTDVCYKNKAENCVKHGRLYDWKTALTACPAGFHLPDDYEWTTLVNYVENANSCSNCAGTKLKAASGWYNAYSYSNGTDQYGFSALPGGSGNSDGYFSGAGGNGHWWSASESDASYAWFRYMGYYEYVSRYYYFKTYLFSVRCVQDTGGQK